MFSVPEGRALHEPFEPDGNLDEPAREPRRESDRERREDDVAGDQEGEFQSRREDGSSSIGQSIADGPYRMGKGMEDVNTYRGTRRAISRPLRSTASS
jgi:hypothetical protein